MKTGYAGSDQFRQFSKRSFIWMNFIFPIIVYSVSKIQEINWLMCGLVSLKFCGYITQGVVKFIDYCANLAIILLWVPMPFTFKYWFQPWPLLVDEDNL